MARNVNNCDILCYADDTLIVATGRNLARTRIRACVTAHNVIDWIRRLGLSVAAEKTEAILFHERNVTNVPSHIVINDLCIDLLPSIKYLGVFVDVKWSFSDHFSYIEGKVERIIRALNRLMPNLRGPDERKRRLFAMVILSVILYGSPV